jgi:hypothetical protein
MQFKESKYAKENNAILKRKIWITTKFKSSEQDLLFAQTSQGISDGSNGATGCSSSGIVSKPDFTFTFHTYFVGGVDLEGGACSFFSTVTGTLSVSTSASPLGEISSSGYRSSYLDTSPS